MMAMTQKAFREWERFFKALANKRRLEIISYLIGKKEANVGDIAHEIKLSFKATSKHLGLLAHTGIVEKEQRDLMMFYSIVKPLPKSISQILSTFSNSRE